MKNIIYSKYSNERAEQFKIRTDILKEFNGIKVVQKTALTEQSKSHINNIYTNYNLLSEQYKDSKISINKCSKIETGLEFEYIIGKTLEEELDELLFQENYIKIFERIKEYVTIIDAGIEKKNFKLTEDFIKVFGNVNLSFSLKAADVNNIDLIFSNIIMSEKWNVIDYEWTFNFPTPFNYIIYRAIRIYIGESIKRNKLINLGLYKLLGITDDEIIEYNKMEKNFSNYVTRDFIPLYDLYGQTTKKNINIEQILGEQQISFFKNTVQVFYDYGKGFSEENSYKIYPLSNANSKVVIEINVNHNVRQVRVDPANSESIVIIDNILGYTTKYYSLDYYTNGIRLNDSAILFTNNDPQIVLMNMKPETCKIELTVDIQIMSRESTIEVCKFIDVKENKMKEQEDKIKEQENVLKQKADMLQEKKNYIEEIENCRSWKYLKRIEKIIGK